MPKRHGNFGTKQSLGKRFFAALHESGCGTKRQLLRRSDMSGVGCKPEVTGTQPK
jgi:hypothetical protein